MSVTFHEIAGSPVEQYSAAGFSARREFIIAWNDRDAFAAEILGLASDYTQMERVGYPGKASVFATGIRYEPLDPTAVDTKTLDDIATELNSYGKAFARALVDYRTIGDNDRDDGPVNEPGTYLTYRMLFATEYQPMTARGWDWEDDPTVPTPDDLNIGIRIPITEHHLTWHQVINPPWATINAIQGTVNQNEFLGCAPGTLLFEGADANKLYGGGFDEGPSAFTWQIRYVFRQRAIKHEGRSYGWNHVYRERPAGWVRVVSNDSYLYDTADHALLFFSDSQ